MSKADELIAVLDRIARALEAKQSVPNSWPAVYGSIYRKLSEKATKDNHESISDIYNGFALFLQEQFGNRTELEYMQSKYPTVGLLTLAIGKYARKPFLDHHSLNQREETAATIAHTLYDAGLWDPLT